MRAEQGSGGNGRTLKRAMAAVYCVEAVVSALVVMGDGWWLEAGGYAAMSLCRIDRSKEVAGQVDTARFQSGALDGWCGSLINR